MSDDTPHDGAPREPGGETPAGGSPPPPYPPHGGNAGGYGAQGGEYGAPGGGYGAQGGGYGTGPDGYQQWPHEAPPGVSPRHKDPHAVSRGVKAAALIFAAACLLHLLTLAGVAISGQGENAGFFLLEGIFVVIAGFVAALVVSFKLPMDSRAAFWISGIAFMALQFIIWGVTCGMAFSVSPVSFH